MVYTSTQKFSFPVAYIHIEILFVKSRNKRDLLIKKGEADHKYNGSKCVRHEHNGASYRYFT
jgi:hypothetical protein